MADIERCNSKNDFEENPDVKKWQALGEDNGSRPDFSERRKALAEKALSFWEASPQELNKYNKNIEECLEDGFYGERYAVDLIEGYGHIKSGVGGTSGADNRIACDLLTNIGGKLREGIRDEHGPRFFAPEVESDKELKVHYSEKYNVLDFAYGENYDYSKEKYGESDRGYYTEVQLIGKYEHFYSIAHELWRAHQFFNKEQYAETEKEDLEREASLFAKTALVEGMLKERKWWAKNPSRITPSPADRVESIDALLDELKVKYGRDSE